MESSQTPKRIVLLAPFEGRYREVGYQALYAMQLAFAESGVNTQVELHAIDDGSSPQSAVDRAQAILLDDRAVAVVILGYAAADESVLDVLGEIPTFISGYWNVTLPLSENIYVYTNPQISDLIDLPPTLSVTDLIGFSPPYTGGDMLILEQALELIADLRGVQVASSFALPDDSFQERFVRENQFAPQPNLIAVGSYETTTYLLHHVEQLVLENRLSRDNLRDSLAENTDFVDGFMVNLPVFLYQYDTDGRLLPVNRVIEQG
ncbi:MAG: hypothetical protein RLP44_15165 [Aggregatilineales bacterium]